MRPANLLLTDDGVLKFGCYGLITQAECYSIKRTDCDEARSCDSEEENETKSDVWFLGVALIEMLGVTPRVWFVYDNLATRRGHYKLEFDKHVKVSSELVGFLQEFFHIKEDRWSVKELMDVSGME